MSWLLAFSLLFCAAGAWFWWCCFSVAGKAESVLRAQADAMVRQRHAAELKAIADARFQAAQQLLEVVRRDRDITIAAARSAGSQPAPKDEQATSLSHDEKEILEALRGFQSVVLSDCAAEAWLILVPDDFPLQRWFPGAQKGATN